MRKLGLDGSKNPFTSKPTLVDEALGKLGVQTWNLDADFFESDPELQELRTQQGWTDSTVYTLSQDAVPDDEPRAEWLFEPARGAAARYCLDGSCFLDVRAEGGDWTRLVLKKGALILVPDQLEARTVHDQRRYAKLMVLNSSSTSTKKRKW